MMVFCNIKSGPFNKQAINSIEGYEAYLPGKFTPGNQIYATIPIVAEHLSTRTFEGWYIRVYLKFV